MKANATKSRGHIMTNGGEKKKGSNKNMQQLFLKQNAGFYLSSLVVFCLWVVFCWQGLITVVEIWYGNEIFNHGFFIVPGAIYLIYLNRHTLLAQPIETAPVAFSIIIPSMLLYVIGMAGDVQLFMHTAMFVLLPSLVWLMIGSKGANVILFPLVFMLFSIPVGEQLIPYLQEIAAYGSVFLLNLSGVPLFRNGLYIEIPQGRFLVAEACSGVSFFIASVVVGSLYAYLNLASVWRRCLFVVIALIFPVMANVVRVYGIILIAYWTDMEHAAGADHLIYGWFFFALVIICLLSIGEFIRKKEKLREKFVQQQPLQNVWQGTTITIFISLMLIISTIWSYWIEERALKVASSNDAQAEVSTNINSSCVDYYQWEPVLNRPDSVRVSEVRNNGKCDAVYIKAKFIGVDNELVSSLNRLYDPEHWSQDSGVVFYAPRELKILNLSGLKITSVEGEQLFVTRWYVINGKVFTEDISAKLYQIWLILQGHSSVGHLVVFATHLESNLNFLDIEKPLRAKK